MRRRCLLLLPFVLLFAASMAHAQTPEPVVLKLASVAPDKTPWSELLKKFKQGVEAKAAGRLQVKLYLGGQLGDENEAVIKCKRGQIQGVGASTGALASQVPEVNVVELPYLFRSAQEADTIIDSVLDVPLRKAFQQYGFELGFWSENGFRNFGTKDAFVKTPADLKGKKMRSQEAFVHLETWKALGASPVPVPTTEVLTALQHGTVDGFDQALLYTIAANWASSIKFYTLSSHIYQPAVIVYNKGWFDALPKDLQQILADEGKAIQDFGRKKVRKITPQLLDLIKAQGVQVYELTAAEKAVFEKATLGVRAAFRKTQGKTAAALLDQVEAGLKKGR
jgi:tripartite ATP-independent transporter DctP family solute receptor